MPRDEIVEHFEKAEDLVDALGRRDNRWGTVPKAWVFRGHADASWPLLPSAFRTPCPLTHHPDREAKPYGNTLDQIGQEIEKVMAFVNNANYQGLPIPGDASRVMRLLGDDWFHAKERMHTWEQFPSADTLEAFSLAQHHGIPTRLLDWSRAPLVAAYFAGVGAAYALNKKEAAERLGVWCFRFDYSRALFSNPSDRVYMVDPPRAPNKNLHAQNGIFTLHVHSLSPDDPPRVVPFDELVSNLSKQADGVSPIENTIRLLTLPTTQARKLLVHLAHEDITAAKLFPGYDGVVRDLYESLHLRQSYRCPPEEK